MAQKPKEYNDDDGRVIVSMDVEGMKWHDHNIRREKRAERHTVVQPGEQLTKREARQFTRSAILAGLTIFAVYAVAWAAIILFMTKVWFR